MSTDQEQDVYKPSSEIIANANVKSYEELAQWAGEDLPGFWAAQAEQFEWFQKWDTALDDSNAPFFKWFVGGKTNIVTNCLDRHVATWRRNKLALIWEGENGDVRTFSYHALSREVCKFANVLRSMGVKKGDRVTIYMGRVPELPIAMLACAKIGAVHSVVYGGFSVEALHGRLEDSESNVCITCDGSYMNGKIVELKRIVDEALQRAATVEHVIVFKRTGHEVPMEQGRDYWWHELMGLPVARANGGNRCDTEVMDAEDPLFMLYTSGTTGKPKAILHTHGGYMVGRRDHAQDGVRPERGRPLLVRRRSGLDHRAFIHRLRVRSCWGPPALCMKARRPTPTRTAGGAWSRSTASTCSTAPRPRSAG